MRRLHLPFSAAPYSTTLSLYLQDLLQYYWPCTTEDRDQATKEAVDVRGCFLRFWGRHCLLTLNPMGTPYVGTSSSANRRPQHSMSASILPHRALGSISLVTIQRQPQGTENMPRISGAFITAVVFRKTRYATLGKSS